MFFVIIIIFMFLLLLIIESYLSWSWNSFYFHNGIKVYEGKFRLKKTDFSRGFEGVTIELSRQWYFPEISVRAIQKNEWGIRENIVLRFGLHYLNLIHGLIQIKEDSEEVVFKSFLNWSISAAVITYLIYSFFRSVQYFIISVIILIVVLFLNFIIQHKRYINIVNQLVGRYRSGDQKPESRL